MKKAKDEKSAQSKKTEDSKVVKKKDTSSPLRKSSTKMGFHGKDEEQNLNAEE